VSELPQGITCALAAGPTTSPAKGKTQESAEYIYPVAACSCPNPPANVQPDRAACQGSYLEEKLKYFTPPIRKLFLFSFGSVCSLSLVHSQETQFYMLLGIS